jgi:PIN domain nuclease of toxin-antitoxin system
LFDEPSAERVDRVLPDAFISAANLAEVLSKLVDRGLDGDEALSDLRQLDLEVVALDRAQAEAAGLLRSATREAGLSLGDRACLALAQQRGAPALTTDRRQAEVADAIGVEVKLIR